MYRAGEAVAAAATNRAALVSSRRRTKDDERSAAAQQGISFGELARIVSQTEGTLNECLALVGQPPIS